MMESGQLFLTGASKLINMEKIKRNHPGNLHSQNCCRQDRTVDANINGKNMIRGGHISEYLPVRCFLIKKRK